MEFLELIGGWIRTREPDGLTLARPGGGSVRVRERVRPIPAIDGDALVTLEGEYATVDDTTAVIEGDDFAAVISAASVPRAMLIELARHYPLGLGNPRRRPYRFRAPAGWARADEPGRAVFRAPDDELAAAIVVHWATPQTPTLPAAMHRALWIEDTARTLKDTPTPPVPITTESGLAGTLVRQTGRRLDGRPYAMARGELCDDRYAYVAAIDNLTSEADLAAFVSVLASIEPIPHPELDDISGRLAFWTEGPPRW